MPGAPLPRVAASAQRSVPPPPERKRLRGAAWEVLKRKTSLDVWFLVFGVSPKNVTIYIYIYTYVLEVRSCWGKSHASFGVSRLGYGYRLSGNHVLAGRTLQVAHGVSSNVCLISFFS